MGKVVKYWVINPSIEMPKITSRVTTIRGKYYRVSLPSEVAEYLDLEEGDVLSWEPDKRNGKKVVVVRKLE